MRRVLLKLFRRRHFERDIAEEMAFHREMAAAGGNPIPFGNTGVVSEQARDLWRFVRVENLWRDVVYAVRGLVRQPGLLAGAGLSLALSIGASSTVFSLGLALLLSEPSVADLDTLVHVRTNFRSHETPSDLESIRRAGLFADVAGENVEQLVNWNDGADTRRIYGATVTANYFETLGVAVAAGRGIRQDDPENVVVLSHRFWTRHFSARFAGGPADTVGQTMNLNGQPYTIVGVLPPRHRTPVGFGVSPDVYVRPFAPDTMLAMYARLKPGMTIAQTRAAAAGTALAIDPPPGTRDAVALRITALGGIDRLKGHGPAFAAAVFFLAMLAMLTLVVLIACVNVAGLLLARASARRRELATRLALGATRGRLVQQLLVESLVLSMAGGAAGFGLSYVLASALASVELPLPLPVELSIDPDWRVAAYVAALTIGCTLACGLLPALQSSRESLASGLRRERKLYLRRTLLVAQIVTAVVVLMTACLFVRNLAQASALSPGFDVRHTVRASVSLPPATYADPAAIRDYMSRGVAALEALPGVVHAAGLLVLPFNDETTHGHDVTWPTGERVHVAYAWNAVTADYFDAMDIRIREGRSFDATDVGDVRAVVVNTAFVDQYVPKRQAIGTTFRSGDALYRIVGVVDVTKTISIGENDRPQLYEFHPQTNSARRNFTFVVRTTGAPGQAVPPVHAALRRLDTAAGLEVSPLESSIGLAFLPSRVGGLLMSSAGLLALALVAIGLFGTMAYSVSRRTREFGLRLAIGATRTDLLRLVVGDAARLLAIGLAIGAVLTLFVTRPLAMFLVTGLGTTDPISFSIALGTLATVGLAAAWIPARRAAATDPMTSLRAE
jgi:predicted permease